MSKTQSYRMSLMRLGVLRQAATWLKDNPKPKNWPGDRWSWAYAEMPLVAKIRKRVQRY